MLSLYFSDIKHYVKARLDELSNNEDAMLVANDQAVEDLEKEIEAAVLPSVRKIHLDAPNILLKDGYPLDKMPMNFILIERDGDFRVEPEILNFPWQGGTQSVLVWTENDESEWRVDQPENPVNNYATGNYVGLLSLPDDFLRLISLKMNGWKRPIQTLVGEDSAEAHKQQNKFLRGTPDHPVGVLTHGVSGHPIAELFTCPTNNPTIIDMGQYYPEPKRNNYNGDSYVNICQPLEYPCLNQITAHVLRGLGRAQEALMYESMAVQPFRIDPEWARLNPVAGERFNTQQ